MFVVRAIHCQINAACACGMLRLLHSVGATSWSRLFVRCRDQEVAPTRRKSGTKLTPNPARLQNAPTGFFGKFGNLAEKSGAFTKRAYRVLEKGGCVRPVNNLWGVVFPFCFEPTPPNRFSKQRRKSCFTGLC